RSCSPVRTCRRASTSHRPCLIARFSSLYSQERVEAETNLRAYVCSAEMAQRIIYAAVVESFCVAKIAFWKVKIHVKEVLALDHLGPDALEVAALEYIACHKNLHDVCHSVEEVICCMNRNPTIACPSHVDFCVIRTFIRELCCLAFTMQTLIPPLDIAIGVDGEVYNKTMYYRSCNSDFTSSVVAYHIWPALMENGVVVVKGEVVTRS
ncbi:MIEAP protein, partial [Vireo altiloquus]|nr:MIEAP protein [Vireo altiloquus]